MQDTLGRALSGDPSALCELVDQLSPVIQKRVARVLLARRQGAASGRDVHQEVQDLSQEVFLTLFANDAHVLRGWSPERGLSLPNFVGLVAERRASGILRSGKHSPWRDDPTLIEDLDRADGRSDPEMAAASRETLERLLERLQEELSPLGRQLFELLFLREWTPDEVAKRTTLTLAAVYAWQSRLRRLARRLLGELSNPDGERQRP